MSDRLLSIFRNMVCWVFGECWRSAEMREENAVLLQRVDRLEQQVQREKAANDWRPGDVFRVR